MIIQKEKESKLGEQSDYFEFGEKMIFDDSSGPIKTRLSRVETGPKYESLNNIIFAKGAQN